MNKSMDTTARYLRATRAHPKPWVSDAGCRTYIVDCQDQEGAWLCDTYTVRPNRTVTLNGRRIARRRAATLLRYFRIVSALGRREGYEEPWEVTRYPSGLAALVSA